MAQNAVAASPGTASASSGRTIGVWSWRLAAIAIFACVWQLVAYTGILLSDVFPPLERIALTLLRELADPETYYHLAVTVGEVAIGFVVGTGLGIVVGTALGASARVGGAAEPYVEALAAAPKVIFLPIAMLMLGIGFASKAAIGALACFFLVTLGTSAAVRGVPPVLVRVGRSLRLRPWQMLFKVYLPAIAPALLTAARLGLGLAIVGVLLSEMKLSTAGIGYVAIDHYNQFRISEMYATLVIIFAVAVSSNVLIGKVVSRIG